MTDYLDPETGQLIDVGNVVRLIKQYRASTRPHQQRAITNQLLAYGTALGRTRTALSKRLDVGMTMLDAKEDQAKQEKWDEWLVAYEDLCDLMSHLEYGVLLGRWDDVVERKAA